MAERKRRPPYKGGKIQNAFPETLAAVIRFFARLFVLTRDLETELTPESESIRRAHIPEMPHGDRPSVPVPDSETLREAALRIVTRIAAKIGVESTEATGVGCARGMDRGHEQNWNIRTSVRNASVFLAHQDREAAVSTR